MPPSHPLVSLSITVILAVVSLSTSKAVVAFRFAASPPSQLSNTASDSVVHVSLRSQFEQNGRCRRSCRRSRGVVVGGHPSRLSAARLHRSPPSMAAERGGSGGPPPSTTKNLGSYYRRPSAAIEKGGGFFVPGLEGFRLRLVFGGVILGLLSLDGLPRPGMTNTQLVSTAMAALAAFVLLLQAFLDQRTERAVQMRRDAIAASSNLAPGEDIAYEQGVEGEVSFFDEAALGGELEGRTRWAADILLQLTPACTFVAFSDGKVLARVGASGGESENPILLAKASALAASGAEKKTKQRSTGDDNPAATVFVARGNSDADDAIMDLLPDVCRQCVLCKINVGAGDNSEGRLGTVLLGSTLGAAGVFTERDTAWFERVCAHLALADGGSGGR